MHPPPTPTPIEVAPPPTVPQVVKPLPGYVLTLFLLFGVVSPAWGFTGFLTRDNWTQWAFQLSQARVIVAAIAVLAFLPIVRAVLGRFVLDLVRRIRVVGHCVLLCGAGCCLWTRGFSGRRARPWGRAAWCAHGPPATRPRRSQAVVPPALAAPVAVGVLYYTKPSGGVSPACRSLMSCNSPRLAALRPWCWLVWRPQCRPPQQKQVTTSCCRRGGPRCGRNSACRGVLLAREPLNMRVNPLIRTSTPQHAPGPGRPRTSHRANVRDVRPACRSSGPRARCQAHVQVIGPTCAFKGPRAGHRAHVRLQGPACVWAGRCAVTSTRALTAMLPDGNYGAVVAGPSN